jgi:DNA-binding NarL/FixJ family response regulator
VLVLTVSAQGEDVDAAIASGAMGYLLKDSPIEEVVTAIRATASAPRPSPVLAAPPPPSVERPVRTRLLRRILD